jgi:hypothetical protein
MIGDLRRINRIRTIVIGLIVGLVWFAIRQVFDIQSKLANFAVLPLHTEAVTALVFLPMFLGAVVTAVYMVGVQWGRWDEVETAMRRVLVFEGVVIAAITTVAWWVVPLAVFGLMHVWLIISSAVGAFLDRLIGTLLGGFGSVGGYISTTVGGGILGGAFGALAAGVLGELIELRPSNSKKFFVIGRVTGVVLGAVYGVLWRANLWFFF